MSSGADSIAGTAGGLLAGHFHQKTKYLTRRPLGTDDWLLILTLGGQGIFRWKAGEIVVRRGDLILARPGTPHDYGLVRPGSPWELQWVHFLPRPQWNLWLQWPELSPGLGHCFVAEKAVVRRLSQRFTDLQRLSGPSLRRHQTLAMNALEEILLWCDEVNGAGGRIDPRIRRALDLLDDPKGPDLSSAELARKIGLSSSRLAHLFAEQVGESPRRYGEKRRLEQARQLLLRTQLPVAEIAREVGFDSPFYFSLRFKKATGLSPSALRKTTAPFARA